MTPTHQSSYKILIHSSESFHLVHFLYVVRKAYEKYNADHIMNM